MRKRVDFILLQRIIGQLLSNVTFKISVTQWKMDDNLERLLTLSKNGDVYTSIRISLTLGCYMNFHIFPMDIQTCPIELESFGYSMDILRIVQIWVPSLVHLLKCKTHQNAQIFNSCTGSKIQLAGKRRIAAKPIYCAPSIWDKGIQAKRLHQELFFRSLVTILSRKCPRKYSWKICNSEQENLHVFLVNL